MKGRILSLENSKYRIQDPDQNGMDLNNKYLGGVGTPSRVWVEHTGA